MVSSAGLDAILSFEGPSGNPFARPERDSGGLCFNAEDMIEENAPFKQLDPVYDGALRRTKISPRSVKGP